MKTFWLITAALGVIYASPVNALAPPALIAGKNLEAQVIVIGEIVGVGRILLSEDQPRLSPLKQLVVLRVLHVVKGQATVAVGDELRIESPMAWQVKSGIEAMRQGAAPLQVRSGEVVAAYLDPSPHAGFYRPKTGGTSLVVLPLTTAKSK
jgi:hypothetical protein